MPGTWTTRSGMPSTSTGSVASSGPTTKATRYVLITIVSAKRMATLPPGRSLALDLGAVGDRGQRRVDDEGDAERRLEVGLVPARERPPAVGGLHLGGGDHVLGAAVVLERAAVEAAQLVVQRARERHHERHGARLQPADRADHQALGVGLEVPLHVAAVDAHLGDVEIDGVQHQLVDGLDDLDGDLDATVERGRREVRRQLDVVACRHRAARQSVGIERRTFLQRGHRLQPYLGGARLAPGRDGWSAWR